MWVTNSRDVWTRLIDSDELVITGKREREQPLIKQKPKCVGTRRAKR